MTAPEEIARLRGLLERATRGPWESLNGRHVFGPDRVLLAELRREDEEGDGFPAWEEAAATTDLIVAMRNALPALLDVAEAALRQSGHNREESCCDLCRALAALGGGA